MYDSPNSGRTHPLRVSCTNIDYDDPNDFHVKAKNLPEVTDNNLFCELIGNIIARRVGVLTPEPAIIRITKDFVEVFADRIVHGSLIPGYGVGAEYLKPQFTPIVPPFNFTAGQLNQAVRMYAYDMLVQNPDRSNTHGRSPNCAIHANQLIAFDFEFSFNFCFLTLFGQQYDPWEICSIGLHRNHLLFQTLRDAWRDMRIDFSPFIQSLNELHQLDLAQFMQYFPSINRTHIDKIEDHMCLMIAHSAEFQDQLYRSLE